MVWSTQFFKNSISKISKIKNNFKKIIIYEIHSRQKLTVFLYKSTYKLKRKYKYHNSKITKNINIYFTF